eukprot:jgi/Tetstr1/449674/TSEL_036742.t1
MPSGMEADSVLARAEDAIRRARRLTTAYSDIWTEQQEELAQQAAGRRPCESRVCRCRGHQQTAQGDMPLMTFPAAARPQAWPSPQQPQSRATQRERGEPGDALRAVAAGGVLRGARRGAPRAAARGWGSSTAGLPRVQALLSALMRARMQQPQPDAEAEARQPSPRAALQPTGSSFDSIGRQRRGCRRLRPRHMCQDPAVRCLTAARSSLDMPR